MNNKNSNKNLIDNKEFKKHLFYGIENKKEVKETILCFSFSNVYEKHSGEDWYSIPNEQFENEIIQEANKIYKQFYRFVTLNDNSNNYTMEVNLEELEKELIEEIQQLKKDRKVIETEAGTFFTKKRALEIKGGQYYIGHGIEAITVKEGWAKPFYEILKKLDELEKEDVNKYCEYWLLTKYARAINRKDEKEAVTVKEIYEALKKNKEDENKIELDDLEI